jgi:hypothetical protein
MKAITDRIAEQNLFKAKAVVETQVRAELSRRPTRVAGNETPREVRLGSMDIIDE